MQFAVPQFTDVEDKLIGPLTLKQFLILLVTGGIVLFFYSILKLSVFFFIFALPFVVIGLGLAFGKFNGRPVFGMIGSFFSFFRRPQVRVFHRVEPNILMKKIEKAQEESGARVLEEPPTSRLKKLAYLLDQKTQEEKELIDRN
jgi:hypothetical protein